MTDAETIAAYDALEAEQNIGICELGSEPHEQGEHAFEGPETRPCSRWIVMTPSEIVEHYEHRLKRHRDHFAEWAKKWADTNQALEAERLKAVGTLAALEAEAKALPSAEELAVIINSEEPRDREFSIRMNIERRDLLIATRERARTAGMRQALEGMLEGAPCRTCTVPASDPAQKCCHGIAEDALADTEPDSLAELVAALRCAAQVGEIRFRTCVLSAQAADQIDNAMHLLGAKEAP